MRNFRSSAVSWPRARLARAFASWVAVLGAVGVAGAAACTSDDPAPAVVPDGGSPEGSVGAEGGSSSSGGGGLDCNEDLGAGGLQQHLSCTGLYTDIKTKAVADGARPFKPAIPFWTDGAGKGRWIHLPPGQKIDTSDMDEWKMPVGTKVWKEFQIDGKRTETRYYVKTSPTLWKKTTYRWNAGETDAERLDVGEKNVNGSTFEIPPTDRCDSCHLGQSDRLLGFEAVNLALPGAEGLTLAKLVAENLLTAPPARTTITIPEDATGKGAAALGYLHSNCASCHSSAPTAPQNYVGLDVKLSAKALLSDTPPKLSELPTYTTTVGKPMTVFAGGPPTRITSGDPDQSGVVFLAARRTSDELGQMPPLGSHTVDTVGLQKVRDWIAASP
ncbi:MAG: hypothetical protein JNL38_36770 [Myxococcales bacterium]|nr:hypothetical protein [Myxococcales bacterium]